MFRSGSLNIRFVNVPSRDTSASKPQFQNEYSTWYENGPKTSGPSAAAGLASSSAVATAPATATTMRIGFTGYLLHRLRATLGSGDRRSIGARPELFRDRS